MALWADLPVPASLELVAPTGERAWFTGSRSRAASVRAAGGAVFGPTEYEAIVVAVLEQRATPDDVVAWIRRKLEQPAWTLDPRVAVDDACSLVVQVGGWARGETPRWRARGEHLGGITWGAALDRLALRLVRAHSEQPAPELDEAATAASLGAM